ncbi:MAG TPA: aldehyde:ferredoxin oxidoreductase [Deltaproteobacteria bacterium]|nr:aldehyde:ferredoxin oxidoreductase [Deltaproteobacteria bacterium]
MASRYKGYMGKILDIDLTSGKTGTYEVSDRDRERFVGGRFLATKILWDELKPGTDPLSSENILVVMTSPLTGTGAPSSSRFDLSAKSPLTGAIGHSNSGGNFGIHLKRAGWDGIVIRGKAKKPMFIDIHEDQVTIKDAKDLWGKDTEETKELMGDKKAGKMVIGPAGENLVKFSIVISQDRCHGRTGMGAVFGSKNLKGIVAKGNKKIQLHDPDGFKELTKRWFGMLQAHPATGDFAPRFGTSGFLKSLSDHNALPTKNFSSGSFKDAHLLTGQTLAEKRLVKNSGCVSCPIRCARVVELDGKEIKGPEYEILCLLGSNMLINDMDAIIRWNYELDLLGIDTISVGTIMGFAAELNEKGLWDNGIEFGKKENISQIFQDIAFRKGIGNDLAEGVRFLSEKYGGKEYAPHSKGLELAAYEPRGAVGHGLGYATANRGACHLDGGYVIYFEATGPAILDPYHHRSKPGYVILDQNLLAAISAGGNCLFTSWTFLPPFLYKIPNSRLMSWLTTKLLTYSWMSIELMLKLPAWLMKFQLPILPHSKALKLATGMEMNFGKLLSLGERGYTMERLFNLREGLTAKDDSLPRRFTHEEQIPGNPKSKVPLSKMLPKYYKLRGWDENGVPTDKTLKKLDLDDVGFLR